MVRLFLSIIGISFSFTLLGQQKHALLIAINTYTPPTNATISTESGRTNWKDLNGCINDARSIKSILITNYLFKAPDIDTIYNYKATRSGIISSMMSLLEKSKKGDYAFIYYSGHGSWIYNSKSHEQDKHDETIVPVDTWAPGVYDIRDKELSKIFKKFIDKGVILTTIFDCCHSGSLSKGVATKKSTVKSLGINKHDANDPDNPVIPDTITGGKFLILSSAQGYQDSEEYQDENNIWHGVFTSALLRAIGQQSSKGSVFNLFQSITAIIKGDGFVQNPVIGGLKDRREATLFGMDIGSLPDVVLMPVLDNSSNIIQIQGGFSENLNVGTKLKSLDNKITIQIKNIQGLNFSEAELVEGDIDKIQKGDLFKVANYISSDKPLLKIYIAPNKFNYKDVQSLATLNSNLKKTNTINWVNNFYQQQPDVFVYYNENIPYSNTNKIGVTRIDEVSLTSMEKLCNEKKVFFDIPPTATLINALKKKYQDNTSIQIVDNPIEAQYILFGTNDQKNQPAYGLMKKEISLNDSLDIMPLQTDLFSLDSESDEAYNRLATNIFELSMRIARIRGWLTIVSPETTFFPYRLEIRNKKTNTKIDSVYKIGDNISLYAVADEHDLQQQIIPQRFIYVFTLDAKGNMDLVLPIVGQEFRFPTELAKEKWLASFNIDTSGTDYYFLVASDFPIPNRDIVFRQKGVIEAGTIKGSLSPLENLFYIGNYKTRVTRKAMAADFNIRKLFVKAIH